MGANGPGVTQGLSAMGTTWCFEYAATAVPDSLKTIDIMRCVLLASATKILVDKAILLAAAKQLSACCCGEVMFALSTSHGVWPTEDTSGSKKSCFGTSPYPDLVCSVSEQTHQKQKQLGKSRTDARKAKKHHRC